MKPPNCVVCGVRIPYEDIDKEGQGLVEFKKRAGDIAWDKNHKPEHPPYAEWFCASHYPRARELAGEHISDAMPILLREHGKTVD